MESVMTPSITNLSCFFVPSLLRAQQSGNWTQVMKATRNINVFETDIILIPLNINNVHWTLVTLSWNEKLLKFYDSLGGEGGEILRLILQHFATLTNTKVNEWTIEAMKNIPRQENSYDCGVFVCQYSLCISKGLPFNFHQNDMKQIREIMIKELTTSQLQSVPVNKPCVAPLAVTSRISAVPEYDPHIFDLNSTAGPLPNPSVAGNSRGKSENRTASATDECHAPSVPPKKRKICDNEHIKDFRTSFRIINTAESHVKSLRTQVRELHQQKRRLHKRLLEKNEKLKQYEHIASDRKKEKSMLEELSKRRANKEIMAVLLLNQVYYLFRTQLLLL